MVLLDALEEALFRQARSPITLVNYRIALKQWERAGVRAAEDVSVAAAQRFVEGRLAHSQVQTVVTHYMGLLAVIAHLEETGRFPADVLAGVRRAAPTRPRRRELSAPFLTRAQVDRYCAGADERARFIVQLAVLTGLRASELARLERSDVDLEAKTLHVRRGKTGPRRVPICAPAIELLRASGTGRVLGGIGTRALQVRVRDACDGSGVRVTLTLCRHTRASWWIQAGVPLAKAAKWLGHSVEVCARHYAGLADAYDPAAELGAAG